MCMNVQSLKSKMNKFRKIQFNLDHISVTESWLNNDDLDWQLELNGFTIFRLDRLVTLRKSGGVACYVPDRYVGHTQVVDELSMINKDIECLGIMTCYPGHKYRVIITVYRPPHGNVGNCYDKLERMLKLPFMRNREVWIMGDMNVNTRARNNPKYKRMREFLRDSKFSYLNTKPTYFHPFGKSTIDHTYTNCDHVSECGVVNDINGDHAPIYTIKKQANVTFTPVYKEITGRSYKEYNREETTAFVDESVWSLHDEYDPGVLVDRATTNIIEHLDNKHPIRTFKINTNLKDGFTPEVLMFIKRKNRYLRKSRKVRVGVLNRYLPGVKSIERHISALLIRNRKAEIKTKLNKYKNDPRRFWAEVNCVWKGPRKEIKMKLKENDGTFVVDQPNHVNNYYSCIGPNLARAFPIAAQVDPFLIVARGDRPLFKLLSTNCIIARKIIGKINSVKSASIPHVRAGVIKDVLMHKPQILVDIVNGSILYGVFPPILKKACVVPLPKGGDLSKVTNWRPVSQLNIFSKLIEKVVHGQLMHYLLANRVIDDKQFGFMPGRSTIDAVYGLVQDVYESRNRLEFVSIAFLDLGKAFDTVDHLLLLGELRRIGCDLQSLSWFKSYLGDRKQVTGVDGVLSDERPMRCGVPQGSVVGPLLFVIYINSIVSVIENCRYYMYADDLAVVSSNRDPVLAARLLQGDMDRISGWCVNFKLTVNVEKTKVLWCHGEKCKLNFEDYPVYLNGAQLKTVKSFNYLGVIIDSVLSFKDHCNKIISSGNHKLYNLRNLCKYMDSALAILLYKTMILPILEYGDLILDGAPDTLVAEIQMIQNHCLRACLHIWDPRTITRDNLHIQCSAKRLHERRTASLLCRMYKLSCDPNNVVIPVRDLRGNINVKLKVQRPKGETYRKSPKYRGHLAWNKLTSNVQRLDSYEKFCNEVKK